MTIRLNILHSIGMIQTINIEIYNYFLKYYYIKNYNGRSIIFNLVIYIILLITIYNFIYKFNILKWIYKI